MGARLLRFAATADVCCQLSSEVDLAQEAGGKSRRRVPAG